MKPLIAPRNWSQYRIAMENFRSGAYGTPENPRLGGTHRCAFWAGYFGRKYPGMAPGSVAKAHHRAGIAAARRVLLAPPPIP